MVANGPTRSDASTHHGKAAKIGRRDPTPGPPAAWPGMTFTTSCRAFAFAEPSTAYDVGARPRRLLYSVRLQRSSQEAAATAWRGVGPVAGPFCLRTKPTNFVRPVGAVSGRWRSHRTESVACCRPAGRSNHACDTHGCCQSRCPHPTVRKTRILAGGYQLFTRTRLVDLDWRKLI